MSQSHREAMNALDASHPQLARLYDRMMTSARIITPPKIEITGLPQTGLALLDYDTIVLDHDYIHRKPTHYTGAIIGHEAGHLISDKRMTYYTPKHILRDHEQEADRIAVRLTGSHQHVSEMRREANDMVWNNWRPSNRFNLRPGSHAERMAHALDHLSPLHKRHRTTDWEGYIGGYGTPEEMEANIRGVDLNDRTHVDKLIAVRNKLTNPELG